MYVLKCNLFPGMAKLNFQQPLENIFFLFHFLIIPPEIFFIISFDNSRTASFFNGICDTLFSGF